MSQKKRRGPAPKRYELNGEMLTIQEIADRYHVSVSTFKNRLTKCGSVEATMKYYNDRDKKIEPAEPTTTEMVDKLMAAIMGPDAEEVPPEPETKAEPAESPAEDSPVELVISSDIINLRAYNRLIDAMTAMEDVPMDDNVLADQLRDLCGQLRGMRCRVFDRLVNWDAIAKGGCQQ